MNPVTQPSHLLAVQRLAQVGSWELDVASQTVYSSVELCRIAGRSLSPEPPLPLETVLGYVHPEDRQGLEAALRAIIQTGKPTRLTYRLCRPDGTVRYLEGQAEALQDRAGRVVKLIGAAQDITERQQIELALRREEIRW